MGTDNYGKWLECPVVIVHIFLCHISHMNISVTSNALAQSVNHMVYMHAMYFNANWIYLFKYPQWVFFFMKMYA